MAASVFMSTTLPDNSNNNNNNPNSPNPSMLPSLEEHPDHHHQYQHQQQQPVLRRSSTSGSGRKKAGAAKGSTSSDQQLQKKKKPPQRGMGIAKLEQIIHPQIRTFKKTGASTSASHEILINTSTSASAAFDHVPVHQFSCSKMGLSQNQNQQLQLQQQGYNYLGFHHDHHGPMGITTTTNHQSDMYGAGGFNSYHKNVASGIINPKDLLISSAPNANVMKSCYNNPLDHCNACSKKKKLVNGENMGAGAVKSDAYTQAMSPNFIDSGLFLGSNIVRDINPNMMMLSNQENQGSAAKPPLPLVPPPNYNLGYPAHHLPNVKQGTVEIVAVHRKESSSSEHQGVVLMEYEFFPAAARTTSDGDHDSVMMEPSGPCGDQGFVHGGGASNLSSSSIDLSLKLSY